MKKIFFSSLIFLGSAISLYGMDKKNVERKRSNSCSDFRDIKFSKDFFENLLNQVNKDRFDNFDILMEADLVDLIEYIDENVSKYVSLEDVAESNAKSKGDILIDKLIARALFVAEEDKVQDKFIKCFTQEVEKTLSKKRAAEIKGIISKHLKE